MLKDFWMRSGRGNCYDNAAAESFFAALKKEPVHLRRFAIRDEAKRAKFEYIEMFYNRVRRHSKLGKLAPVKFERRYYAAQVAA